MTTPDALATYREVSSFQGSLTDLHPLKLDRWHRGLLDLPDAIYMQYGCPELYEQIGHALKAIRAMVEMLGEENLPVDPQEIARRKVGKFSWHIPSSLNPTGTTRCLLLWNQEKGAWTLACSDAPNVTKTVTSFVEGFEIGKTWVSDLESSSSKEEGVEEVEEAP